MKTYHIQGRRKHLEGGAACREWLYSRACARHFCDHTPIHCGRVLLTTSLLFSLELWAKELLPRITTSYKVIRNIN